MHIVKQYFTFYAQCRRLCLFVLFRTFDPRGIVMVSNEASRVVEQQRELIERLMDRTGMSLSALAVAAGLSASTMTRAWRERTPLRAGTMVRLLSVSPDKGGEGLVDRTALTEALALVHEAMGLSGNRARAVAAATASLYRRTTAGDHFGSQDDARRAAEMALETAEAMAGE